MSAVSASAVLDMDTLQNPIKGLDLLMGCVCSAWLAYEESPDDTTIPIEVPPGVQRFTVGGDVYRLDDLKRVIWFPLTEDGHNGNQFIVSVALDQNNQPWQLTLDRCRGINHDELILVRARRLGGLKAHRFNWVPGSRVG